MNYFRCSQVFIIFLFIIGTFGFGIAEEWKRVSERCTYGCDEEKATPRVRSGMPKEDPVKDSSISQPQWQIPTFRHERRGKKGHEREGHDNKGAINPETGEFYPGSGDGVINPRTGEYYPGSGGGYINPRTGKFYPSTGKPRKKKRETETRPKSQWQIPAHKGENVDESQWQIPVFKRRR